MGARTSSMSTAFGTELVPSPRDPPSRSGSTIGVATRQIWRKRCWLPTKARSKPNEPRQGTSIMPLLDHFHPPVSERRGWEGFHGLWAAALVEKLNRDILADDYFADMQVHIGSAVEVDVATMEESARAGEGGVATAARPAVWTPPKTDLVIPTVFPD